MIWNAVGSLVYALASMALAFFVLRLSGQEDGGIFGFGYSTLGQQMFIISYFGIRSFQITDMRSEYSFGDYLRARKLTSLIAFLGGMAFPLLLFLLGKYSVRKAVILFLLCCLKVLDGFADVYESELQRQGRLYKAGQSLCFRTIMTFSTILLVLLSGFGLLAACLAALLVHALGVYFFAVRPLRACPSDGNGKGLSGVDWFCHGRSKKLLWDTFFLFASVFLDFYVFSASKYAVDNVIGSEGSGIFNVLFMPASFIYLVANFLIRPTLTRLSMEYAAKDFAAFRKTSRFIVSAIAGLAVLIVLCAFVFGRLGLGIIEWILGGKFRGLFTAEWIPFLLIIGGGGLYALSDALYYILVTLRRQRMIFVAYVLCALAAFLTADNAVRAGGIQGGALHYLVLMVFLLFLYAVFSFAAFVGLEKE